MERRVPDPRQSGRYVIPEDLEAAWDATVEELAGEPVNDDDGVSGPRYDPDRERAALALVGKVRGTAVPIAEELDRYMAQEGVKASYAARTRAATKALTDWLTANRHADNIQSVMGYFTVAMKRPILPVHDSFVVARRDEWKLAETMALAYQGQLSRRVDNPVMPVVRGFSSDEQEADFLAFVARWS